MVEEEQRRIAETAAEGASESAREPRRIADPAASGAPDSRSANVTSEARIFFELV